MYQLNNGEVPQALTFMFVKNNQVHNYRTRHAAFTLAIRLHFPAQGIGTL